MFLTERRKQFLGKLIDLYQKTNLPVHYETLAKALGVSKWTAYDMLRELEKLGYLARDYALNRGEAGRSQIVFRPTLQASRLFEQKRDGTISAEEWQNTKAKVLQFLNKPASCGLSETVQKMAGEMAHVQVQVAFCAYIIGLLLVHLRYLGEKTGAWIKHLVRKAPTSEMRITMFVGTVLGAVIEKANHEIGIEITDLVGQYLQSLAGLSEQERGMLADFLDDALA